MDINELRSRFSDITACIMMPAAVGGVPDQTGDNPVLVEKIDTFKSDLAAQIAAHPDNEELAQFLTLVEMLEQSIVDPEFQKTINEALAEPLDAYPQIFDAIERKDIAAVRIELKSWDVNAQVGKYGSSALYHAMSCSYGEAPSLEIISLLLDAGADPRRGLGETNVLHGLGFAYWSDILPENLSEIVKRCVALGADLEQRSDELQWTPLILAISEWNEVATEALLLAGADPHVRAGDTGRGCFSGADCLTMANGHPATTAVLKTYLTRQ